MTVTPVQSSALRAALTGDEETFERLTANADFLNGDGFPVLVATAFVTATQRRFPPGWSHADVVRFVGHLRARNGGAHEDVSATAAEQMLLGVLSREPMAADFDENAKSIAQFALLTELVSDLNEHELSSFLAAARERADAWLACGGTVAQGVDKPSSGDRSVEILNETTGGSPAADRDVVG